MAAAFTGRYFLLPPSSMGIILACMMLVILLIMGLVRFHSLQKAACTALCCLPSLLLGLVYIMIR